MTRPTVFLSYCHKDEVWKDRISGHLRVLGDLLEVWEDRQIGLGENWLPKIQRAIDQARVAILVISKDFLNSPFIKREEVPRLLRLRQTNGLTVIPVIAYPCVWEAVPWLAGIQCYPEDGRALARGSRPKIDEDLANLTRRVRDLLSDKPVVKRLDRHRTILRTGGGPISDIDQPWDLSQTGWSVVFAPNLDLRVRSALEALLTHRRGQATRNGNDLYYRECSYLPGESTIEFLIRYGAKPGTVADPNFFPYYVLLVGDPESFPYQFQSELDVNYAVGRIYFDHIDDYAAYARSVVRAEEKWLVRSREVVFFGPEHKNDSASRQTARDLVHRLAESVGEQGGPWTVHEVLGENTGKEKLRSLLGGTETPAFLFTACHGLGLNEEDERQRELQGALVCQDWPGPDDEEGVDEDQWFAARDVSEDASLHGLIAFFYSCYSVGTPRSDSYDLTGFGMLRPIAPQAFVSQLPQRLLSHRGGGALAVIGHIDRSWTSSFSGSSKGEGIGTFLHVVRRLLRGDTVGWAMESLNQSQAALASMQANLEQARRNRKDVDAKLFADLDLARNDMRNFMVFGDPAVRLPGVGEPP